MSTLLTTPHPSLSIDLLSPIHAEDCPACDLTAAISCPACNGTGTLLFGVDSVAASAGDR